MSNTAEFFTHSGQVTTATTPVGERGLSETTAGGRPGRVTIGSPGIQPTLGDPDGGGSGDTSLPSGPTRRSPRAVTSATPRRVGLRPEVRAAIKSYHHAATAAADGLFDCAKDGDVQGIALAVREIAENVQGLWRLKKAREMDWQAILNFVRLMFKQAVVGDRAEKMTPDECHAVRELIGMLGLATRTADDLNEALRLVRDAGFDPYSAISHPDE